MLLIQCIIALTLIASVQSPAPLDAKGILEKTEKLYLTATSYHFDHELLIERKWPDEKQAFPLATLSYVNASENVTNDHNVILWQGTRYREEIKNQDRGSLEVADGSTCWFYNYFKKEYMRGPSSHYFYSSVGGSMLMCTYRFPFWSLRNDAIKEARLIRQEKVLLGKEQRNCYVIQGRLKPKPPRNENGMPTSTYVGGELFLTAISLHELLKKEDAGLYTAETDEGEKIAPGDEPEFTFWIDTGTFALLRSKVTAKLDRQSGIGGDNSGRFGPCVVTFTDKFKIAKLNTEIPSDLFDFVPPAGAKEIPNIRTRKK